MNDTYNSRNCYDLRGLTYKLVHSMIEAVRDTWEGVQVHIDKCWEAIDALQGSPSMTMDQMPICSPSKVQLIDPHSSKSELLKYISINMDECNARGITPHILS